MSEFIPMSFSRIIDGENIEFLYLHPWVVHDAIQKLKDDIDDESLEIDEIERMYIHKLINKHLKVPSWVLDKERDKAPKYIINKYKGDD